MIEPNGLSLAAGPRDGVVDEALRELPQLR